MTLDSRSLWLLTAAHARCEKSVQVRRWYIHEHLFLWGFLKKRVYSNNPRSLEELKHNIEQTVASIDLETLFKVARNTLKMVDACLREHWWTF
jgi:hypothetical protein